MSLFPQLTLHLHTGHMGTLRPLRLSSPRLTFTFPLYSMAANMERYVVGEGWAEEELEGSRDLQRLKRWGVWGGTA